jgi:hypothetical protein
MSDSDSLSSRTTSEKLGSSRDSSSFSTTEDVSSTGGYSMRSKEELAALETRRVRRSRAVFMLVLLVTAATAGAVTYIFTSKDESRDFIEEVSNLHVTNISLAL